MPEGRIPGSHGSATLTSNLDDGTMARMVSPAPGTVSVDDDVSTWDSGRKLLEAARLAGPKLPAGVRSEFNSLFTADNAAITAGVLAVWAASHWIGVGEVVDVLLLVGGIAAVGWQAATAAREIADFVAGGTAARSRSDLDAAAGHLAKAVVLIGVTTFIAFIMRYGGRLRSAARSGTGGAVAVTTDEWLAMLGKSKAPLLVRSRVTTAVQFFRESFPGMRVADVLSRLRGIDFSQDARVVSLARGTELVGYGDPGRLGMYYTKVGTSLDRLGIAEGAREFMRFRLNADVMALESRASGIADTWTSEAKALVGGGGVQYVVPDAARYLELAR